MQADRRVFLSHNTANYKYYSADLTPAHPSAAWSKKSTFTQYEKVKSNLWKNWELPWWSQIAEVIWSILSSIDWIGVKYISMSFDTSYDFPSNIY